MLDVKNALVVVFLCLFSFNLVANEAEDYFNKGIVAKDKKDYELAVKWLTKA